jgi:hypothetical protein
MEATIPTITLRSIIKATSSVEEAMEKRQGRRLTLPPDRERELIKYLLFLYGRQVLAVQM